MKRLFLVFAIVALAVTGSYAQKGEKSVGLKLNYGSEMESFGLGAQFSYNIMDALRISPSFNYYFEHNDISLFNVDADAHYLFPFATQFAAYPLAGVTFQAWKHHILDDTKTRLGINVGGGLQFDFLDDWRTFTELKYSIVNDVDQFVFSVGIAFRFH
ncbi:MAG: porin family protein [Prevotellaceae bacterium]|jgi:outer membrane protein X|nr:porin family protein [Prevotellaceae bacterium]